MRVSVWAVVAAFCAVLAAAVPALAVEASEAPRSHPLAVGGVFPDVTLLGEIGPEAATALGVPAGKGPTALDAVRTEILVVEIFSMYCPYCQKDAPTVNALHELITKRGLANRIAVIGVGAGNSDTEVGIFRKKFGVPFPLFADAEFRVHGAAGQVGTPFFYVLKKRPDGRYRIVEASLGVITSPEAFLSGITRVAGI